MTTQRQSSEVGAASDAAIRKPLPGVSHAIIAYVRFRPGNRTGDAAGKGFVPIKPLIR